MPAIAPRISGDRQERSSAAAADHIDRICRDCPSPAQHRKASTNSTTTVGSTQRIRRRVKPRSELAPAEHEDDHPEHDRRRLAGHPQIGDVDAPPGLGEAEGRIAGLRADPPADHADQSGERASRPEIRRRRRSGGSRPPRARRPVRPCAGSAGGARSSVPSLRQLLRPTPARRAAGRSPGSGRRRDEQHDHGLMTVTRSMRGARVACICTPPAWKAPKSSPARRCPRAWPARAGRR